MTPTTAHTTATGTTAIEPCAVHHAHEPTPTYSELHHIIPQAWQIHWQPTKPWPNAGASPDHAGVTLWDARTVAVCRTGHGNIHFWLVKVMRAIVVAAAADPEETLTWKAALGNVRHQGHTVGRLDAEYSMQALIRYTDAGGKIADLISHGLWGEI